MKIHDNLYKQKTTMKNNGFTLVELIVVIAIMGVLAGVTAPMFMNSMSNAQMKQCETNRNAILSVYERTVLEGKKEFKTEDLQEVLRAQDTKTQAEVLQYNKCPKNGTYDGEVDTSTGVAKITCSHTGHAAVEFTLANWEGSERNEKEVDDDELTPP